MNDYKKFYFILFCFLPALQPLQAQINPEAEDVDSFIETLVAGHASPYIFRRSSTLRYLPSLAPFYVNNDFTLGSRQVPMPDSFSFGLSFLRGLRENWTLNAPMHFLAIQNFLPISDGQAAQALSGYLYVGVEPSVAWRFNERSATSFSLPLSYSSLFDKTYPNYGFGFSFSHFFPSVSVFQQPLTSIGFRHLEGFYLVDAPQPTLSVLLASSFWEDRLHFSLAPYLSLKDAANTPSEFNSDLALAWQIIPAIQWTIAGRRLFSGQRQANTAIDLNYNEFHLIYSLRYFSEATEVFGSSPSGLEHAIGFSMAYAPNAAMSVEKMRRQIEQIQKLLLQAEGFYQTSAWSQAIDSYQRVLELSPGHQVATEGLVDSRKQQQKQIDDYLKNGRQNYDSENYLEAMRYFKYVLDFESENVLAERYYNLSMEKVRDERENLFNLAEFYYNNQQYNQAMDTAESLLLIDSEDRRVQNLLVDIQQAIDERDKKNSKGKAIEEKIAQGDRALAQRDYEGAELYYEEAGRLGLGQFELIALRNKIKQQREEDAVFDEVSTLFEEAKGHLNEGDMARGMTLLNEVLRQFPDYDPAKALLNAYGNERDKLVESLKREGLNNFNSKNYIEARENWENALRLSPKDKQLEQYLKSLSEKSQEMFQVNRRSGQRAMRQGNLSEARGHYIEALKLKPGDTEIEEALAEVETDLLSLKNNRRDKAISAYERGQYNKARDIFLQFLNEFGEDEEAQSYLAKINISLNTAQEMQKLETLVNNRSFEEALSLSEALMEVQPEYPGLKALADKVKSEVRRATREKRLAALFQEGVNHFRRKNYNEAIEQWSLILGEDPQNDLVKDYLQRAEKAAKEAENRDLQEGKEAFEQEKWFVAREKLRRALDANSENSEAKQLLTDIGFELQNYRSLLKQDIERNFSAGKYQQAKEAWETVRKIDEEKFSETDQITLCELAVEFSEQAETAEKEQNLADAVAAWSEVLKINPEDTRAKNRSEELARILRDQKSGLLNEARTFYSEGEYKKALQRWELLLGQGLLEGSEATQIEARVRQTETLLKGQIQSELQSARSQESSGQLRTALASYRKILEMDPVNVEAKRKSQDLSVQLQQQQSRQQEQKKRNVNALFERGINEYKQENYSEAIRLWQEVLNVDPGNVKARDYVQRAKTKQSLRGG